MILIADSGSSKTDWILLDHRLSRSAEFITKGLNPNVITGETIEHEISVSAEIKDARHKVKKLFFYGAGCSNANNIALIETILRKLFPAAVVHVKSDLYAAAYATCGSKTGIVCILGTGSNSCFYDGLKLDGANYNLGYLLGDEGSGYSFGRRLLRDYFYGILPVELKEKFAAQFPISREELIKHIYHEPFPNQYVASFTPFIKENISHPYCSYLVNFGFDEFLKIFVTTLTNYKLWPAHFVGSVAANFKDQLIEGCKNNGISVGTILQSPIEALVQYHISTEAH